MIAPRMALIDQFVKLAGIDDRRIALERKLVEEYERIDTRGPDLAALEAKEKEAQAAAAKAAKDSEALLSALKNEMAKVEAERKAAIEGLDKGALEVYQQALDRHGDRA